MGRKIIYCDIINHPVCPALLATTPHLLGSVTYFKVCVSVFIGQVGIMNSNIKFIHNCRTWFYSHWHFPLPYGKFFGCCYRSGSDRFCPTLQRAIFHSIRAFRSFCLNISFPSRRSRFIEESKQDRTDNH